MAAARRSWRRCTCSWLATASCATSCERRVAAARPRPRVHFAGARRDLGNLLGAIDMFVMPSLWEGLPLSLVLAMGAGLPVDRVAGRRHSGSGSGQCQRPARRPRRQRRSWPPRWCAFAGRRRSRRGWASAGARVRAASLRRRRLHRVDDGALRRRLLADRKHRVTLGILYHMPFWQAADGSLWEAEGSFARYVDSLAPYFDEVVLSVPVFDRPQAAGSRVRASNVRLAPLPYFPGPRQFYPMLPRIYGRLKAVGRAVRRHPLAGTDAGGDFRVPHRPTARRKPVFLLVVGDYEALLPHLPYRGVKKHALRRLRPIRRMGAAADDIARADVHERRRASPEARARRRRALSRPRRRRSARTTSARAPTCARRAGVAR